MNLIRDLESLLCLLLDCVNVFVFYLLYLCIFMTWYLSPGWFCHHQFLSTFGSTIQYVEAKLQTFVLCSTITCSDFLFFILQFNHSVVKNFMVTLLHKSGRGEEFKTTIDFSLFLNLLIFRYWFCVKFKFSRGKCKDFLVYIVYPAINFFYM